MVGGGGCLVSPSMHAHLFIFSPIKMSVVTDYLEQDLSSSTRSSFLQNVIAFSVMGLKLDIFTTV